MLHMPLVFQITPDVFFFLGWGLVRSQNTLTLICLDLPSIAIAYLFHLIAVRLGRILVTELRWHHPIMSKTRCFFYQENPPFSGCSRDDSLAVFFNSSEQVNLTE